MLFSIMMCEQPSIPFSLTSIVLFMLLHSPLWCQYKFEREFRVPEHDVHIASRNFMDSAGIDKKIKWYREESQDGTTVEAKVRHLGARHSIEFDTAGNLLDIEVEVRLRDLEAETERNIVKSLDSVFSKYKIRRIQAQWSGSRQKQLLLLQSGQSIDRAASRYEIVIKGKRDSGNSKFYEVLIEANGGIVKILPIITRSVDNLDF